MHNVQHATITIYPISDKSHICRYGKRSKASHGLAGIATLYSLRCTIISERIGVRWLGLLLRGGSVFFSPASRGSPTKRKELIQAIIMFSKTG